MTSINSVKVGLASGLTVAIFSLVCALFIILAPSFTFNLANNIFHGIDITQIEKDVSWGNILIGFVEIFVIGFIAGWLFALIYNKLND